MFNKLPRSGTIGTIVSLVGWLQRFFSVPIFREKDSIKGKSHSHKRARGTNAEYHLTFKQVMKILNACRNERNKMLIQLLTFTGIRRAEVAHLQIPDILWDERLLVIQNGKGSKQRFIPLSQDLLDSLKKYTKKLFNDYLFPSRNGGQLSFRQINNIVTKAGELACVTNPNPKAKNVTCHLFRHTFARLWKQQGGSMESLSKILGHEDQSTTLNLYGVESLKDVQRNYNEFINALNKK